MKFILYFLFVLSFFYIMAEPKYVTNVFPYGLALFLFCLVSIALACSKDDALTLMFRNWITRNYKALLTISALGLLVLVVFILSKKASYDIICFMLSVVVIIFSIPLGNRSNTNNLFIILGVFILACVNWTFVSYFSYYNGVTQNLKEEGIILQTATYEIIKAENIKTEEKRNLLDNIFKQSRGEITLSKNDKIYLKGGKGRNNNEYILETHGDPKSFNHDNNSYHVLFEYANRPVFSIGIIRAITFSASPDWFDYRKLKGISFEKLNFGVIRSAFNKVDNDGYFRYGSFRRSTNLWAPFWVLYLIFLVLFYYVAQLDLMKKQSQKAALILEEKQNELDDTIIKSQDTKKQLDMERQRLQAMVDKLNNAQNQLNSMIEDKAEIYQLMAAEMQQEMRDITTSQAKNTLQKMVSNWADKKRSVFSQKEITEGLTATEKAAHDMRHILLNKWPANECYKKYPDDVKLYVDEILEDLKEIPNVISVKMDDFSIKSIMASIEREYNKFPKDPQVKFSLNNEIGEDSGDKFCRVNLHRINSIVFNLLSNSVKITDKFGRDYLDEHDEDDDDFEEYTRMVNLDVRIIENNSKPCLSICVKDNGGGFNDEIIDKIYKEKIKSGFRSKEMIEKGRSEMGEGTAYISFFVDMMGGEILAENYQVTEKFKGAKTVILLPIRKKQLQED